jgi:hypothetical protein
MSTKNVLSADNQQERLIMSGWIVGFVDGEGCFSVSVFKNKTTKSGYQVMPEFVVTQGEKSLQSLQLLRKFFNCGNIYVNRRYDNHKENIFRYCVRSLNDLNEIVVPFFKTYNLKTSKKNDFELFCKLIKIITSKQHLTVNGLNEILTLKNPQRLHVGLHQLEKI